MEYSQPKIKSENASLSKINITICHDFFDTLPYLVICLINPTTQNNRKPAMALLCFPRKYQASISGKTTITSNKRFKKKKRRYVNIPRGWLWVVTLSSNNVTRAKRKLWFHLTMELNHAYWLNGLFKYIFHFKKKASHIFRRLMISVSQLSIPYNKRKAECFQENFRNREIFEAWGQTFESIFIRETRSMFNSGIIEYFSPKF